MSFILQPRQLFLLVLSAWVNRYQQQTIDFYICQTKALLECQGKKRILLNDDQRRMLAVKGKALGRKALSELTTIVTPDTILRWHRELVAQKWDYTDRRKKKPGRPAIFDEVKQLVLRMAKENPDWGYDRIQGALGNLGHEISDQTVGNILKAHGIEPAPERKRQTTWKTFLKAHWDVLGAIDFTTVEVWTKGGIVTFSSLARTRCGEPSPLTSSIITLNEIIRGWRTSSFNRAPRSAVRPAKCSAARGLVECSVTITGMRLERCTIG